MMKISGKIKIVLYAALFVLSSCAGQYEAVPGKDYIKAEGRKLYSDGREILLRGITITLSGMPNPPKAYYKALAELGVNSVRLVYVWSDFYSSEDPYNYREETWKRIDRHIELAKEFGIWIIIQNCGVEGAQFVPIRGIPYDYSIWSSTELQDRYLSLWKAIAKKYCNEKAIAGYSIFSEPVTSGPVRQWHDLAQKAVENIREADADHVVFIDRIYGENEMRRELSGIDYTPEKSFSLINDKNAAYEFYFFERDEYTHQFAFWRNDLQKERIYPDEEWIIKYSEDSGIEKNMPYNRDYLEFYLQRQLEFGEKNNVPMAVWGFGAMQRCYREGIGGLDWLGDVTELFNEAEINWSLWGYYENTMGIYNNEEANILLKKALAD